MVGVGTAEQPGVAVLDQRRRAALGDRDDRQPAGAGLEDHLAVGVGDAAEEEDVGARVGDREVLAAEPAEEGGGVAEPRAQLLFLGAAARQQQVQPGICGVGAEEGVGEQVDALLLREPARVEDLDLARVGVAVGLRRVEALDVHPALPAADLGAVDAELGERAVGGGARREHPRRGVVEEAEARLGDRLEHRVGAQARVGGELGVVAGEQRHAGDPAEQRRRDPGRAGGGDVDEVVVAFGERLDQLGDRRDAQLHAFVEGQLELGRGGEAAVDAGVGADHVDVEAGHAALADLLDRVRHPVHRADPVGDQGDAATVLVAAAQLRLLGAEEGGRGRVGEGRDERLEDAVRGGAEVAALEGGEAVVDGDAEAALVAAAGAAVEVGVGEAVGLQHLEQLAAADLDPDPGEPGLEQAAGVLGADVGGDLALAGIALADHPFGHLQDRGRVGGLAGDLDAGVVEGAGGERHRGVRPLRGGTLFAPRLGMAVAHQGEKLFRRGGGRHLGPGAADVHAGVVVGAGDPGAAVGVDVDGGGHVQLRGARPVADLPDREELGQPAPVAPCERRRDGEEGMRQTRRRSRSRAGTRHRPRRSRRGPAATHGLRE